MEIFPEISRLSGFRQRPFDVQDDETTKRKILEEDRERSGKFLRDFMSRHRNELADIEGDGESVRSDVEKLCGR
jgi:hypothetical protein